MKRSAPRHQFAIARHCLAALSLVLVAACAPPPPGVEFHDPHEERNRQVHEANRALDTAIFGGPSAEGTRAAHSPLRTGISNFADNLRQPSRVLNNLLQFRIGAAVENTFRFLVNSTVGLGGVLDPAADMGLAARITDFGETLHVWGFHEGAYIEHPFLGPSTERDTVGMVVDAIIDPLGWAVPSSDRYVLVLPRLAARIGDRSEYGDLVEMTLYGSADSYAQSRLLYLQNRRFQLGDERFTEYYDPYDDPYDDPF